MSALIGLVVAVGAWRRWRRPSVSARLQGTDPGGRDRVRRFRARPSARPAPTELLDQIVEATDLMTVAVRSGLNVRLAVGAVSSCSDGRLGAELSRVMEDVHRGIRLGDALDGLILRLGDEVRPLCSALAASDRYGDPLVPALERLAGEQRAARRRRAEAAARRLPIKLLFPLVVCILPAFALLTVAPLIAGALSALRL